MSNPSNSVFADALAGDRGALARAISRIDDRADGILEAVAGVMPHRKDGPGKPHVLGITGPPGAGKSTLTDRIVAHARENNRRVAVIAVDPSSPFSGGAILGDRLRMEEHATDEGVYVRSLASRGHLGGLSRATGQVVHLLDAVGFDLVIVETVGVGQSELAVMEIADTVLVVLTPESGDVVQTMKAGLLEVADVFLINKADRAGALALQRNLEQMTQAGHVEGLWPIPVHLTSALERTGIEEAIGAAEAHQRWNIGEGRSEWDKRRAAGRVRTFLDLVGEDARAAARAALDGPAAPLHDALRAGDTNPYQAAADWARE